MILITIIFNLHSLVLHCGINISLLNQEEGNPIRGRKLHSVNAILKITEAKAISLAFRTMLLLVNI